MTTAVLLAVEQLRRRVPGGIGRYATGLLDGLADERRARPEGAPSVTLHASRRPGPGADPLGRFGLPVAASPLPAPLLTRAWDRALVAAPGGFDVVHAVSLAAPPVRPSAGSGSRAARRRPALVVTVHDLAWRHDPAATTRRGRRWHEAALTRALVRADALVAPSAAVAAELRDAGAPAEAVRHLPWGVDHLPPADPGATAALLARLGVGGGYLLTAGTLEPRKNLARLVAAYAAARPSLPEPWPLVVVGPAGWGTSGLGDTAAGGGAGSVPAGVVATGAVDDPVLAGLYAGARAFAYVPLTEGFGFPPVEAMVAGVPVVASTTVPSVDPSGADVPAEAGPGPAGTSAGGGAAPALRVDPRSVDDIAAALVVAAADEAGRADLVRRGAAWVAPMSWRRSARAHAELWDLLS